MAVVPDDRLDLADYETSVVLRPATPGDFDAIIDLQERCFPGMKPWRKEHLANHHRLFPDGQMVVDADGKIIGSSSSLIVEMEEYGEKHTFSEITAGGTLETHDPEGTDLYGIEVMVDPEWRGYSIGERLYQARRELCERLDLKRIVLAGRIPNYHKHQDLKPKEYVEKVARAELTDPVLGFQLRQGFVAKRVIRDYIPHDEESCGFAVLLEWSNIDYQGDTRRTLKTSHPVRLCLIQYQMREVTSFADFARQTEYFVDVASNYSSDFAVFPELLTTQLLSCIPEKKPADAMRKLASYTDDYIRHFNDLAVGYNVNILAGTHIIEERGRLYNVAFLFKRDGTIAKQYKLHITPNETRWWGVSPGRELTIIDTDVGKVAISICYDVEFPEIARIAVDRGARILFVPYCTEDRQGHLRVRYCAQARAVENQIYVVTAGTVGNLPETENMDIQYAQSAIFTPSDFTFPRDGVAAEADANVETVVVGDIDLEVLRRHRKRGTVMQLRDRRHDLYEVRAKKGRQAPAPAPAMEGDAAARVHGPVTG